MKVQLLTSVVIAAALLGSPAMAEPDSKSSAEKSWRAEKSKEEKAPKAEKGEKEAKEKKEGTQVREGRGQAGREAPLLRLNRARGEAERLDRAPANIERELKELEEQKAKTGEGAWSPERLARRERILELRAEIIELERAEFVERMHADSARIRQFMKERAPEGSEQPVDGPARLTETLDKIDAAQSFEEVKAALDTLPVRRGGIDAESRGKRGERPAGPGGMQAPEAPEAPSEGTM